MRNPGKPGSGFRRACTISSGDDGQVITEADPPYQVRVVDLDRAADFHLSLGQIGIAERLAHLAADPRALVEGVA